MKTFTILLFLILTYLKSFSQNISGEQLLEKAISYHDPEENWKTFNGTLFITMETPNSGKRDSEVTINLPESYFKLISKRDSLITTHTSDKGACIITKSDSLRIAKQTTKLNRSHCETTELYKNYYTYLYGLPMKLKNPGTNISDKVETKRFKGKDYLTFRVDYDSQVGSDVWYFYFNPTTYAMEIYQFFKTDDKGKIKPDSGEYILLKDEAIINHIKMPKARAWFYNKDDTYLGTDILTQ